MVTGILVIIAYSIGIYIGFNLKKEELPIVKLPKIEKSVKMNKQDSKEIDKLNTMLENIENYDGTGKNQKEIK